METLFGRALVQSLQNQGETHRIHHEARGSFDIPCSLFTSLRRDETNFLQSIPLANDAVVLDYGCGIGRHLDFIRNQFPDIRCIGVEICDLLRTHCQKQISPPAEFVSSIEDLHPEEKFDLILMMGNGFGILGDEEQAEIALMSLVERLKPNGRVVTEFIASHNYFSCPQIEVEWRGQRSGPFVWGEPSPEWMKNICEWNSLNVLIQSAEIPGGYFATISPK